MLESRSNFLADAGKKPIFVQMLERKAVVVRIPERKNFFQMVPFELQRAGPARGEEEVRALGCGVGVSVDCLVVERHGGRKLPVCKRALEVTFQSGINFWKCLFHVSFLLEDFPR